MDVYREFIALVCTLNVCVRTRPEPLEGHGLQLRVGPHDRLPSSSWFYSTGHIIRNDPRINPIMNQTHAPAAAAEWPGTPAGSRRRGPSRAARSRAGRNPRSRRPHCRCRTRRRSTASGRGGAPVVDMNKFCVSSLYKSPGPGGWAFYTLEHRRTASLISSRRILSSTRSSTSFRACSSCCCDWEYHIYACIYM